MSWKKYSEEFKGLQKKSKRAPFNTSIVIDEVEERQKKAMDQKIEQDKKDRRKNEKRK